MQGGTTLHFPSTAIEDVLAEAAEAAGGLVGYVHVMIAPILLGRGTRLWDDLCGLGLTHTVATEVAESGTTHVAFTR